MKPRVQWEDLEERVTGRRRVSLPVAAMDGGSGGVSSASGDGGRSTPTDCFYPLS